MHPILRNLLAVLLGLLVGSLVNSALLYLGDVLIEAPEGADFTTAEGLAEAMGRMEFRHFVFPFLAHAGGTFSGAWVAARLSRKYRMAMGVLIGLFFFAGGVAMVWLVPAPLWFILLDLLCAYFPMAFLGARLALSSARPHS